MWGEVGVKRVVVVGHVCLWWGECVCGGASVFVVG